MVTEINQLKSQGQKDTDMISKLMKENQFLQRKLKDKDAELSNIAGLNDSLKMSCVNLTETGNINKDIIDSMLIFIQYESVKYPENVIYLLL